MTSSEEQPVYFDSRVEGRPAALLYFKRRYERVENFRLSSTVLMGCIQSFNLLRSFYEAHISVEQNTGSKR